MTFRRRLVGAVAAVTIPTLGVAFVVVGGLVGSSQELQLDRELRAAAGQEAGYVATLGPNELEISDRPGPPNDVGPLTKLGAVYSASGVALTSTPTFAGSPPARAALMPRLNRCFDFWHHGQHLRGVLVAVPTGLGAQLLLAVPRKDLDNDEASLRRVMAVVFVAAVLWAVLVASWLVGRVTREHEAIAAVTRAVAQGDLSARVVVGQRQGDVVQLARDVNDMIERISALVSSQREFIAHAAHELRSPLTTLYGELSLALRRDRDADGYRQTIEAALHAARRLKVLAEDLLALARVGRAEVAPAEVIAPLASIDAALKAIAVELNERRVRVQVAGTAADVWAAPGDLERLFRNLIENAVRHSPPEGVVDVLLSDEGAHVMVTVTDDGPGVAEDDAQRIFEPFYRGARARAMELPGAGLGLAIARQVARTAGGDVSVGDAQGRGARFVVRLAAHTRG